MSAPDTTALATAEPAYRSGACTVTTLMVLPARYAPRMLADLLRRLVGCGCGRGRVGKAATVVPDGHGDVVAAEWFIRVWGRMSGL